MGGLGTDTAWEPYCDDTHGTSVAGIIGAQHNNGGVAGIAPGIVHSLVRGFRRDYPCRGVTEGVQAATDLQLADGLNWLWRYASSDVMTNSWGCGVYSQAIADAIHNAVTLGRGGRGTPVIFSAGNTSRRELGVIGGVCFPGTLDDVITVSAIDRFGALADYSPQGKIDVVAPSGHYTGACVGEVVTTDRASTAGCNDGPGGDIQFTTTFSGTSAAAPQVAATAALMLSRYPALTPTDVKNRIRNSAVNWGAAIDYGAGKLSAYNAIF